MVEIVKMHDLPPPNRWHRLQGSLQHSLEVAENVELPKLLPKFVTAGLFQSKSFK